MDNTIHFAVGFKSYDLERISGTAGVWYEWTERSINVITRTSFNKRLMEWIVQTMKEASKMKGNFVRRWRKIKPLSEIFIARNFNKFGRYISLINAVRSFKWENRNEKETETSYAVKQGGITNIKDSLVSQNEVLKRSLVGVFNVSATLSEVRKWSNSLWKQAHGLNIYEMGNGLFLFEFTSKLIAEHLVNRPKSTWIRIVGLPLHSQKIFKIIGEYCGGSIEIEEETTLRNHVKWARVKARSEESSIPKEVKIENGGVLFSMQICAEALATVVTGEENWTSSFVHQLIEKNTLDNRRSYVDMTDLAKADKIQLEKINLGTCDESRGPTWKCGTSSSNAAKIKDQVQASTESKLGPTNEPFLGLNEGTCYKHMSGFNGLQAIKILASQFLEAVKNLESTVNEE
ncbi:hypothetical protein FXO38_07594 [Capsicum annuum]|nr:hypothetical protein FXO38_07594 [Capsicum annuum]